MFNHGEGRALHRPRPAERAQHAAHQRRLARAELARQRDDHPAGERAARAARRRARSRRRRAGERRSWRAHACIERRGSIANALCYARAHGRDPPRRDRRARRDWAALAARSRAGAASSASTAIGIADTDLAPEEARLVEWLAAGRHGAMDYMARHGAARARPAELVPGHAARDHRPHQLPAAGARDAGEAVLGSRRKAYVARYALGRDYHKVLRRRLQQLAERIAAASRRRSAIACSPTARRCSKSRWPRRRGWAGAASTRCC